MFIWLLRLLRNQMKKCSVCRVGVADPRFERTFDRPVCEGCYTKAEKEAELEAARLRQEKVNA